MLHNYCFEIGRLSVVVVRHANTRHRWDETCLVAIIVIKSTDVVGIVLRVERKLFVIEQPISLASPTDSEYLRSGMQYMIHNEVACLMLGKLKCWFNLEWPHCNKHNMGKTVGEIHAMLIEYEKGLPKKAETPQVMMIKSGKIQKSNKKSLKAKGKGKTNGIGKNKQVYIPKPKNPKPSAKEHPAKDDTCHHYKEVGQCKRNCPAYLAELIKKKKQLTPPYTPQHNGVFERRNRTLLDMVRSMMNFTTLPLSFWDYALESATRILNMVPTKKVDKTLYELWYGKVSNLSYLKVWGCKALVKRDMPDKLQQRYVKCIFIGYPKETICYYFYFLPENKIVVVRSERTRRDPDRLYVEVEEHSIGDLNEPTSYKAAMLDSKSNKWIDAMNVEIQSMMDNMVWVLVDLTSCCKTVGSFVDPNHPRKVCKLQRSIYGLKQASRSWNKRFDEEIKRFGFTQNLDEPCVYQKASGSNVTFLILYVDDIIIMGNHIPSLQSVKDYLGKCSAVKDLGEATFILGIKIYRDRSKRLIGLSQNAYMDKILKRYKMDNSKRGTIPMQERLDLNKSQGAQTPKEVNRMKNVPYASAVGSIMYAVRCTRPDVAFAQNLTSRFQQNPLEDHGAELRVNCYCNTGFEIDIDDMKSLTGYVSF
ncbi:retrotransposon protein, putative, ty1-copia subclass [Tanacetum coccineum]